ncbi:MAG: hypothetical protein NTV93_19375 [Verrucomicrobia bacterium]|nr:hypothetical protein [Verrucomicrobiota bacterium]
MKYRPLSPVITKLLLPAFLAILLPATPGMLEAKEPASPGILEFSCVTWNNLPCPDLFYRQGNKYLPIKLSPGQRSQSYPLKDARALELFIPMESPADGAKPASPDHYEMVGLAPLLEGAKRMLFLIEAKKDSNGLPLQLRGLDDSVESFPAGSFRFINLTPDLLRIEFGGATHELPQGEAKVVAPDLTAAGGFVPVIIKDAEGRKILENRFFAQPTGRELVVISPPADGRPEMSLKFLSDVIPATPTPRKKASSPR